MKVAILSDIHANLHALQAVLEDLDRANADEIWFLGDIVVYGPSPRECVRLMQERGSGNVGAAKATQFFCGNNDYAIINNIVPDTESLFEKATSATSSLASGTVEPPKLSEEILLDRGNTAKASHIWTSKILSNQDKSFLREFAQIPSVSQNGKWITLHANLCDPIGLHGSYVRSKEDAEEAFVCMEMDSRPRICFLGHTHIQSAFCQFDPNRWYANVAAYNRDALRSATLELNTPTSFSEGRAPRWLINPGSVGQPRDGDPDAAYAIFDTEALTAEFRRVRYDIEGTVRALEDIDLSISESDNPDKIQARRNILIERLKTGGLK